MHEKPVPVFLPEIASWYRNLTFLLNSFPYLHLFSELERHEMQMRWQRKLQLFINHPVCHWAALCYWNPVGRCLLNFSLTNDGITLAIIFSSVSLCKYCRGMPLWGYQQIRSLRSVCIKSTHHTLAASFLWPDHNTRRQEIIQLNRQG